MKISCAKVPTGENWLTTVQKVTFQFLVGKFKLLFRDGGAYFEVGGAENGPRRRELVGGSGGILPQKILKSRVSEIVFTAFSARYFLK